MLKFWRLAVSAVIIVGVLIFTVIYGAAYLSGGDAAAATGSAFLDFRVHYIENDLFGENPIPRERAFLTGITDFIEIEASLAADFNRDTYIEYTYTATEHLVIRHGDGEVVHQESEKIAEGGGTLFGNSLRLRTNGGDSYVVYPRQHIERQMDFIGRYHDLAAGEAAHFGSTQSFTADLFKAFTFVVYLPEFGVASTIEHGYHIPLGSDTFVPAYTGDPFFTEIIELPAAFEINFPIILAVVGAAIIGIYVFTTEITRLRKDTGDKRREAATILRQYEKEIVITPSPLNVSDFKTVYVQNFADLVKLAINQNSHIMCYCGDNHADFTVIIGQYAYFYKVEYDGGDGSAVVTSPVSVTNPV